MKELMKKGLVKKRVGAVLLSVLPMIIYFLVLLILSFLEVRGERLWGEIYDKLFPLMNAASMAAASLIMCRVLRKRTGKRLRDVMSVKEFDLLLLILLLVFSWCAGNAADSIIAHICSGFMTAGTNASPVTPLGIAEAIFAAPILEEIMFRYLGTEFAVQFFPMPLLCAANAVYFALVHGYNIQGFANTMVFALCMAYLYLKTRRLLYMMLVHMIHNAACLLDYGDKLFLGSPVYSEKNGFLLGSPQWIAVNLVAAAVCAVIYLRKYRGKRYGK